MNDFLSDISLGILLNISLSLTLLLLLLLLLLLCEEFSNEEKTKRLEYINHQPLWIEEYNKKNGEYHQREIEITEYSNKKDYINNVDSNSNVNVLFNGALTLDEKKLRYNPIKNRKFTLYYISDPMIDLFLLCFEIGVSNYLILFFYDKYYSIIPPILVF